MKTTQGAISHEWDWQKPQCCSAHTPPQTLLVRLLDVSASGEQMATSRHSNHKEMHTPDSILGIYPTDTCKYAYWPTHNCTYSSIAGYGKRPDITYVL